MKLLESERIKINGSHKFGGRILKFLLSISLILPRCRFWRIRDDSRGPAVFGIIVLFFNNMVGFLNPTS